MLFFLLTRPTTADRYTKANKHILIKSERRHYFTNSGRIIVSVIGRIMFCYKTVINGRPHDIRMDHTHLRLRLSGICLCLAANGVRVFLVRSQCMRKWQGNVQGGGARMGWVLFGSPVTNVLWRRYHSSVVAVAL